MCLFLNYFWKKIGREYLRYKSRKVSVTLLLEDTREKAQKQGKIAQVMAIVQE